MAKHVICDTQKRFIYIRGKIEAITFTLVKNSVARLVKRDSKSPITVFLESKGGDFYACLSIFELLKNFKIDVFTVAVDCVRSGAFFITQAGKNRFAVDKKTTFEFHMSVKDIPKDMRFNAIELTALAITLQSIDAQQLLIFCERGRPVSQIQNLFFKNTRISAQMARQLKLIDGILPKSKIPKI
ncbi:MAG: ATP-dependent Clp protease proteolytic subunit [Patescibacteria group bacterium]